MSQGYAFGDVERPRVPSPRLELCACGCRLDDPESCTCAGPREPDCALAPMPEDLASLPAWAIDTLIVRDGMTLEQLYRELGGAL